MSESFWLLLLLAVAGAWFAHFIFRKHWRTGHVIPKSYVKQLNNLLDHRQNQAVDSFINLFTVNTDTVETHIMFGNLFRQRGETEKAIRIHQNIINKSELSNYYCAEAMLELARDYFVAGLYDRAERLLRETLSLRTVPVQIEVCHQLTRLYEIEKNWLQAITTAKKLKRLTPTTEIYNSHIAHYYCELAEKSMTVKNYLVAEQNLAKAKSYDSLLLRANILLGDIALQQENFFKARQYYESSLIKHPDFTNFVLPKIQKTLGNSVNEFLNYLKNLKLHKVNSAYIDLYFRALVKTGEREEIKKFFTCLVDNNQFPLSSLATLLQYESDRNENEYRDFLTKIIKILDLHARQTYFYKCSDCGFESERLYWQCPGCWHWDTHIPHKTTVVDKDTYIFPDQQENLNTA